MSAHTSEGAAHPSAGMTAFVGDLHGRACGRLPIHISRKAL